MKFCSKRPTKLYISLKKQLASDAPKVGGDNIACVFMFGFPEKMNKQAPEARERLEKELLK